MTFCSTINYKGLVVSSTLDMLTFRKTTPIQATFRTHQFTVIVFKNKVCRLMGVKKPLTQCDVDQANLPFKIKLGALQSSTWTLDFGLELNLSVLQKRIGGIYEPELFPALRLTRFNPMCINIFHSGKCVITGYKSDQLDCNFERQLYLLICQPAHCVE